MQLTRGFTWAFIAAFSVMCWTGVGWVVFKHPYLADTAKFSAEVTACLLFLTALIYKLEERNAKTP